MTQRLTLPDVSKVTMRKFGSSSLLVPAAPVATAVLRGHRRADDEVGQLQAKREKRRPQQQAVNQPVKRRIRSPRAVGARRSASASSRRSDEATIDQQLYVGFSRARNHCVVVAPG